MYEMLIKSYVKKLTINDINLYANKNNIILKDGEDEVIYTFIKNNWREVYSDNTLKEIYKLKDKLSDDTFNKVLDLYKKYHDKIK